MFFGHFQSRANHIQFLEDSKVKEGDILRVYDGMVRENNGYREVHLGNTSKITLNPEGESVEVRDSFDSQPLTLRRKRISELVDGDNFVAITGAIVHLFEPRFYDACGECGKKVYGKCNEHNDAAIKSVPVMNLFFDDGSENIRVVLFREQALEILGINDEKIDEIRTNASIFEEIKKELNGKELTLIGRVVRDGMFERREFIVQKLMQINPSELAGKILET